MLGIFMLPGFHAGCEDQLFITANGFAQQHLELAEGGAERVLRVTVDTEGDAAKIKNPLAEVNVGFPPHTSLSTVDARLTGDGLDEQLVLHVPHPEGLEFSELFTEVPSTIVVDLAVSSRTRRGGTLNVTVDVSFMNIDPTHGNITVSLEELP